MERVFNTQYSSRCPGAVAPSLAPPIWRRQDGASRAMGQSVIHLYELSADIIEAAAVGRRVELQRRGLLVVYGSETIFPARSNGDRCPGTLKMTSQVGGSTDLRGSLVLRPGVKRSSNASMERNRRSVGMSGSKRACVILKRFSRSRLAANDTRPIPYLADAGRSLIFERSSTEMSKAGSVCVRLDPSMRMLGLLGSMLRTRQAILRHLRVAPRRFDSQSLPRQDSLFVLLKHSELASSAHRPSCDCDNRRPHQPVCPICLSANGGLPVGFRASDFWRSKGRRNGCCPIRRMKSRSCERWAFVPVSFGFANGGRTLPGSPTKS